MSEQDKAARARLAELMDERRDQLGLHWNEVARLAGLTKEGLRTARLGPSAMRPATKRGIEKALQWETGSVDRILEGGDPDELAPAPEPPMSVFDVKAILARLAAAEARLAALESKVAGQ